MRKHGKFLTALIAIFVFATVLNPFTMRAEAGLADECGDEIVLCVVRYIDHLYPEEPVIVAFLNVALGAAQVHFDAVGCTSPRLSPISRELDQFNATAQYLQMRNAVLQACAKTTKQDMEFFAAAKMLSALDDSHTAFIPPQIWQLMQAGSSFVGIGVQIRYFGGQWYIWIVYPGTPAALNGLRKLDRLLRVDDLDVTKLGEKDASKISSAIRGQPDSSVSITVQRSTSANPLSFTVTRKEVVPSSVDSAMLKNNVGYLRIFQFSRETYKNAAGETHTVLGRDVEAALRNLSGMQSLIVDVRGNSGGLLFALYEVASLLVPKGSPVFILKDRSGTHVFETDTEPIVDTKIPIVVLTDGESASASELLTAALQENRGAIVVGEKTAGAVEASTLVPLPAGAGMSVTVRRVFTGQERRLEHIGVTPNFVVEFTPQDAARGIDSQIEQALRLLRKTSFYFPLDTLEAAVSASFSFSERSGTSC